PGLRVDRNKNCFTSGEKNFVVIEGDTPAGWMQHDSVVDKVPPVAPENCTRLCVERYHLITRSRHEHDAVVHNWRCLVPIRLSGSKYPCGLQASNIGRSNLIKWCVTPAVVGSSDHQPIAVFRLQQALGRYRLVVLQNRRNWGRWLCRGCLLRRSA